MLLHNTLQRRQHPPSTKRVSDTDVASIVMGEISTRQQEWMDHTCKVGDLSLNRSQDFARRLAPPQCGYALKEAPAPPPTPRTARLVSDMLLQVVLLRGVIATRSSPVPTPMPTPMAGKYRPKRSYHLLLFLPSRQLNKISRRHRRRCLRCACLDGLIPSLVVPRVSPTSRLTRCAVIAIAFAKRRNTAASGVATSVDALEV
jgi:hypothetical protein